MTSVRPYMGKPEIYLSEEYFEPRVICIAFEIRKSRLLNSIWRKEQVTMS